MLDQQESGLILVVDDSPINLSILSHSLKRAGFKVAVETDGQSAIEQVNYNPPDLILLDIKMPGLDGFETCRQLKFNSITKDIPIIFMTALAESEDKVQGLSMGAVDYITKPFQHQEVIARVRTHLQIRKLSLALAQQNQILKQEINKKIATEKELSQTLEQLKKFQQQIIAQEKLASLGSLTAGIAHELKNPLNFINNFASVSINFSQKILDKIASLTDIIPSEKLHDISILATYLQQSSYSIYEQGKQADNIIRSMLLHARGDLGKFELIDLNQLLEESLQLALKSRQNPLSVVKLTLDRDYDSSIGKVMLNPQSFSRGLINIIHNGIDELDHCQKNTDENFIPVLALSTRKSTETIEIHIKDNGSGINSHIINKIFEPFFTTKSPGQGTGLGLSITYDIIVNQHQGQLKVESVMDEYTEFLILLPVSN